MLGFLTSDWITYAVFAAIIIPVVMFFVSTRPDAATAVVFFITYSNIAVILQYTYGLPQLVTASYGLLLVFPLLSYVVFRREKLIIDYPFLLMIGFLFVLLLSALLNAKDMDSALNWIVVYVSEGLVLYFLIINVVRRLETLRRMIWILLLVGSLLSGFTLYQELTGAYHHTFGGLVPRPEALQRAAKIHGPADAVLQQSNTRYGPRRAEGPIGDPNRFGQILAPLLPFGLFLFWRESRRWMKAAAIFATVLVLCGALLTYSRGTFVTIVFLLIIMTFMRYIKAYQLVITLATLIILMLVAAPGYLDRISTLRGVEGLFSEDASARPDAVTRSRVTEMLAALLVFVDHPILGVGPGQYSKYYSLEYMKTPEIAFRDMDKSRRAHCLYTELAAETGAVGFSLFTAIVFLVTFPLWTLRRQFAQSQLDLVNMATLLLLGVLALLGTSVFLHLSFQRFFWLIIGLAGAGVQILRNKASNSDDKAQIARDAENLLKENRRTI